jgi:hypothetical protein
MKAIQEVPSNGANAMNELMIKYRWSFAKLNALIG